MTTGMTFRRRLVCVFLTLTSLLCVYILCMSLEIPMPWLMLARFHGSDFTHGLNRSRHIVEIFDSSDYWNQLANVSTFKSGSVMREPTPATQTMTSKPPNSMVAETKNKVFSESKTDVDTRNRTRGPMLPPTTATKATELSFIGDTYLTEDIPPQSDCPEGIQHRVTKTEFAAHFLKNIPVLQWAKHGTRQQFERLSRYPGAHGWGGINYETLVGAVSVLSALANRQMFDDWSHRSNGSQCIRCAVVGNGGILKDAKQGRVIDGHDYVFRTNGAVIKGFEEDVGSRTTHYTFSTNTLRNSMRSYAGVGYKGPPISEETRYIFLPDHDRDYLLLKAVVTHTPVERGPEHSNVAPSYFGEDVSAEKFKMYHPDFIRYLRNRFLRSRILNTKHKDIYRPSTGAVMLLAALHTCDQVSAYGFMTPDYQKYSDHYYDSSYRPVGFFANHDFRLEMNVWQQLHRAGLMKLYMRD
ncbi:alpha-N-acetylgalactosaminide alpha-2,6-sialyltransferase 2 isoform X2 [Thalassophryne amazonica]|uniref:alpha-N-acetylgalactosaminide alpha-2,6-sialyltransferase 2 isoform X2 n=1 Tax=Thalassophryne amazonica TaxID=390379 RepID=UPI0014712B39|nr:alpha-N-acetylgalactosaminide alpha-2,6-sialyltransferase 2 isoform X2 [Thalassophryne amazonica]